MSKKTLGTDEASLRDEVNREVDQKFCKRCNGMTKLVINGVHIDELR